MSSADQNLARQEEALRPYDLDKVFADKASGKNLERIEFQPKSRSKPSRYSSENDVLIEKSVKYTDFFLLLIVYV